MIRHCTMTLFALSILVLISGASAIASGTGQQQLPRADGFEQGDYRGKSYRGEERGDRGFVNARPQRTKARQTRRAAPDVCTTMTSRARPGSAFSARRGSRVAIRLEVVAGLPWRTRAQSSQWRQRLES